MGGIKYVMLGSNSRLKGEKDWEKYEVARKLKYKISSIRSGYMADMRSNLTAVRQRAVAIYFIDTLALRAGHEKDSEEAADTVSFTLLLLFGELIVDSLSRLDVVLFELST